MPTTNDGTRIDEGSRFHSKARRERLDLPHVQTAAYRQHFADDALAAYLGQVLLG